VLCYIRGNFTHKASCFLRGAVSVQCLYSVEPQLRFIRLVWMEDFEWILCVSDKVLFISDNSVCVLWTCPVPSWQSGLKEL